MCPKESGAGIPTSQEAERAAAEQASKERSGPTPFQEEEVKVPSFGGLFGGKKKTHTVKAGETLSAIAKEVYGDSKRWKEIYEANKALIGDNPNMIKVGQELRIP